MRSAIPLAALIPILFFSRLASAAPASGALAPPNLKDIGIEQKLDSQVPLDTMFRDESGASVPLRKYFGSKPVILAPVYYTCPMLCSQILSGVVAGFAPTLFEAGPRFRNRCDQFQSI